MVTDTAKEKIKHHLSKRGRGVGIRIGVETTGCNGYAYKLEFADTVNEEDTVNKYDDFSVLMDPKASALLEGITLDYQKQGLNEGFEFINPLEKARCGCGKTFSI
jgi:iron-sulfur cluster assembly protein|tara:strand:- start:210 stop:524 length:315 start_codon:yes stop_codon:yes gene_type:complete